MELNKATDQQAGIIVELLTELYAELGEEAGSIQFLTDTFVTDLMRSGKTEIYLVNAGKETTVGIVTLTETQALYAGGKYGSLDEMYIRPGFRSAGTGKDIIAKIKTIGRHKKWKRIDVTAPTEERWKRTVAFYEKNGFVFTGSKFKMVL